MNKDKDTSGTSQIMSKQNTWWSNTPQSFEINACDLSLSTQVNSTAKGIIMNILPKEQNKQIDHLIELEENDSEPCCAEYYQDSSLKGSDLLSNRFDVLNLRSDHFSYFSDDEKRLAYLHGSSESMIRNGSSKMNEEQRKKRISFELDPLTMLLHSFPKYFAVDVDDLVEDHQFLETLSD